MKYPPAIAVAMLLALGSLQETQSRNPEQPKDPEQPKKTLPLPGEVFAVAGRTAFLIPARTDAKDPA